MATSRPFLVILGFGAFGRLLAQLLAPHADLAVLDPRPEAQEAAAALGLTSVAPERMAAADIVILALPLMQLEAALHWLAPRLRPGQVVVDVCSVKEEPARLLQELLPPEVELLGSHPMFGPASAARGLAGAQVVLCPLRGRRWRMLARFLSRVLGLEVIVTTPEDHDRQAAMTQGLTHLLAHALLALGDRPRIRTASFDLVAAGLAMVENDAAEVYETIAKGNRHFAAMRTRLLTALAAQG